MKPATRRRSIAWVPVLLLAIAALSSLIPLSAAGVPITLPVLGLSPAPPAASSVVEPRAAPSASPAASAKLSIGAAGLPWEYLVEDGEDDFLLPAATPGATPGVAMAAWTLAATEVRAAPDAAAATAFVLGAGFPVTVQANQTTGSGWLLVEPRTMAGRQGYVPADALTYELPAATATVASMDALSPELADYLAGWGLQVGVTVTDLASGTTYSYNGDHAFITASSVKVALMFTLLRQLEAAGRSPSEEQVQLLTAMIEWSDNDAAQAIDLMVGDRAGLQAFADELTIPGFHPGSTYENGWGWGTLTPDAMVRMLTLFQQGQLLSSPANNDLARRLLGSIDEDQRTGVGSTAPAGATVLLKNGWVPGPDDRWVFNSSGIVEVDGRAWIVAAYTAHNDSLEQGQEIVTHACAAIAAILG